MDRAIPGKRPSARVHAGLPNGERARAAGQDPAAARSPGKKGRAARAVASCLPPFAVPLFTGEVTS